MEYKTDKLRPTQPFLVLETQDFKQEIYLNQGISHFYTFRLEKTKEYAKTVTLKIRYSNFETYTKSKTLKISTRDWEEIFEVAKKTFRNLKKKDDVRLIGIHLSSISKSNVVQLTLT